MNNKHQFALNRLFNLFIIIGIVFGYFAVTSLLEQETTLGIVLGIFSLFFLFVPLFAMPYCYRFDSEGVTACYLFFPNERYLWVNIHTITVEDDSSASAHPFLDLLFSRLFKIKGRVEGQRRPYMQGHIQKSRRTKRLLEKYWDGTITGYFGEGFKAWRNKRKGRTHTEKSYQTDEIIPMERRACAKAKEWVKPFAAQAAQVDLELRAKFRYVTKDFEELKSRPNEGYTYTVIVEISHRGEKNESRVVEVSADLLYVRIGKKAYRGVVNENALQELQGYLTDTLEEIRKNGIESYCGEK